MHVCMCGSGAKRETAEADYCFIMRPALAPTLAAGLERALVRFHAERNLLIDPNLN